MQIPRPRNDEQTVVLSAIWDLFVERGELPAFREVDRRLDQQRGIDAYQVIESMPDGLIYGTRTPIDNDPVGLTVAAAATVWQAAELVNLFVSVVRYGAELHRTWAGPPVEATKDPVIRGQALPQVMSMPAAGRDQLLQCLRVLLLCENWGWNHASDGADWTFTVDRRIREYRGVSDVQDYLSRRYGSTDETASGRFSVNEDQNIAPNERLAIVEGLSRMSGPDSEALFAAHGLGRAYASAGKGASKKGRINAALIEAERQGRINEILASADEYLHQDPKAPASTTLRTATDRMTREGASMPESRLFISHAFVNKELATAMRNALVLGGVPNARIFFSSLRSTGIPAGKDVRQHLREQLVGAGLVIELLTPEFLLRPMCLLELGAAWALEKETYPIVVPPLKFAEAKDAIGDVLMGQLGTDEEIDDVFGDLADRIGSGMGVEMRRQELGEAQRYFKTTFRALPSPP